MNAMDVEIQPKPEPRIVVTKRFRCPFCKFTRATKRLVVEHIARCWHDPANKTCRSCLFFERGYVDHVPGRGYAEVADACAVGESVPPKEPVVGCPVWRDRDDEEDEPAEDAWSAALRELGGDRR